MLYISKFYITVLILPRTDHFKNSTILTITGSPISMEFIIRLVFLSPGIFFFKKNGLILVIRNETVIQCLRKRT